MSKVFIITWKNNSSLGFDFSEGESFNTREEAQKVIDEELSCEDCNYEVMEVSEAFIYIILYAGADVIGGVELNNITDKEENLDMIEDFFNNVTDERIREEYVFNILEAETFEDVTYGRKAFFQNKINYLASLMD